MYGLTQGISIVKYLDFSDCVLYSFLSFFFLFLFFLCFQAKTLLEEVMLTCSHSEECAVLFSDEMSGVVPCLDHSLLEYLGGQVTEKFQETYLVEIADGVPQKGGVSMDYLYSLDTTDEGSIALSLFPMVVDDRTSGEGREKKEGLVGMASLFRLLRMCEVQLNGNLDGIDALLGKGSSLQLVRGALLQHLNECILMEARVIVFTSTQNCTPYALRLPSSSVL